MHVTRVTAAGVSFVTLGCRGRDSVRRQRLEEGGALLLEQRAAEQRLALRVPLRPFRERPPRRRAEAFAARLDRELLRERTAREELAVDPLELRMRCAELELHRGGV